MIHWRAHQLIPGSHRRKSLKTLFSSARQSDDLVNAYYGKDSHLQWRVRVEQDSLKIHHAYTEH